MQKNGKRDDHIQKWRCPKCRHYKETPIGSVEEQLSPDEKQIGITENQLRAKHDNRYIIERKCQDLKQGAYLTNAEFITWCGIKPGMGYRNIIEHPDYDKYHGRAGSIIYWSNPASIKKLKDEGVLT